MNFDFYLFSQINGLAGQYAWLDLIGVFFAKYFPYIVPIPIAAFLLVDKKKYFKMVVGGFASAIFARFFIVEFIRFLIPRYRPFVNNHVNLLVGEVHQQSFPSGHAAFFFALSTIVYYYNKKTGIVLFICSSLISFFRVFVGIHWPADIFFGAIVGILTGLVSIQIYKKYFKNNA
ncbi:MAG: phosphatase PAP2 family protein [Candidatus Parcubacteria bacterium]|nr:phosphatase PAP2 family protein [Candidatus Parcubacteria bacterium]